MLQRDTAPRDFAADAWVRRKGRELERCSAGAAQRSNARVRLFQTRDRQSPRRHGGDDALDRLVRHIDAVADQQKIRSGCECVDRCAHCVVLASGRDHMQAIGYVCAGKPHLAAQHIDEDARARCRLRRVEGRRDQMCAHDRDGAGCDGRKRDEIAPAQGCSAGVDDGQAVVRIHGRQTVTGEMLVARQHAAPLQSIGQSSAESGHALRVGTEGARPDYRICRVEREIEHQHKVHRRAGAPHVERHLFAGAQG